MLTIAWRGDSRSQERLKSRPKGDAGRLSRGQDSQLWWLMPRIPALRQKDNHEFEGGLPYIANSRLARATQQDPVCHDPSLLQRPVCLLPLGGGDEDWHRRNGTEDKQKGSACTGEGHILRFRCFVAACRVPQGVVDSLRDKLDCCGLPHDPWLCESRHHQKETILPRSHLSLFYPCVHDVQARTLSSSDLFWVESPARV